MPSSKEDFSEFEDYSEFEAPSGPGALAPDAGVPEYLQPPEDASLGDKAAAFGTGAMEGMTLGAAPYISAAADVGGWMSDKPYMSRVGDQQAEYARRRARAPGYGTAGDIIGSFVPGVLASPFQGAAAAQKLGRLSTIGASAVDAAGQNALRGALDKQSTGDLASDAGVGLAAGAIGAGLSPLVNRGVGYGAQAFGYVTDKIRGGRDAMLEKIGASDWARTIVNPDRAIDAASGPLGAAQKKVYNTIADVLGADNLGASAAKATAEQKSAAVAAMVADAEAKLGTPVSDAAKQAIATQVDEALAAGAESGATLGGALRLMVKDDPAAVSKRVMTSIDAWQPITPDMDPRALSMRDMAGKLRGDFEGGKLNRAFGQGPQTGRAYDIGRMDKPGYATASEVAANEAPLATKVGDLREVRMANDEARFAPMAFDAGPAPMVATPSTDLGIRPVTPETATGDDIYQLLASGTDLPFPLDKTQLNKLTNVGDMQAKYGQLGTKHVPINKMGQGTKEVRMDAGDEGFLGSNEATKNVKGPAFEKTRIGGPEYPPGAYDATRITKPLEPVSAVDLGVSVNPAPVVSEATRVTNRQIGRQAVNKAMALGGAIGGGMLGMGGGGAIGMATGTVGGMLTNTGVDAAAALGKAAGNWGKKQMSPAGLASSWLENPTLLQSVAQRPDALGRAAQFVLSGAQQGANAMKARAYTLALDPQLRAMMSNLDQGQTDQMSQ